MAWTTPKTWTNAAVTASEFNVHIRDNLNHLKGILDANNLVDASSPGQPGFAIIGARVHKTSDQTLTDNTTTAITYANERFDSDAFHDNVSNTSRLTVPAALGGYYLIGCTVEYVANATGRRTTSIAINGTGVLLAGMSTSASSSSVTRHAFDTLYELAGNDYVELTCYQNSGGSVNVVATASHSPEFWLVRYAI